MQLLLYLNLIQPRLTCLEEQTDMREDFSQASKKDPTKLKSYFGNIHFRMKKSNRTLFA